MSKLLATTLLLIALFVDCSATWWFLKGLPLHALGTGLFCDNIPGLSVKQRKLCRRYPDVMISIGQGIQLGLQECQHQFRHNRWNCSSFTDSRDAALFSRWISRGNREVAFIYAISSAGVAHAIAKACSEGTLNNCACDQTKTGRSRDARGEFDWTGCSDNVKFGIKLARMFIDAKESNTRDVRRLMNLQNNSAGRRGVHKHVVLKCKCHGVSGSCSVRTCWKAMQHFAYVGDFLKKKYNRALLVAMNQDATGLIPLSGKKNKPEKSDIVYMEKSPDYCVYNSQIGSVGTSYRECNTTSGGCDEMCCGRGFDTKTIQETVNCGCKFEWCCTVKCKECTIVRKQHICKGV